MKSTFKEENFVSFKIAELAGKKGFKEPCIAWFNPKSKKFYILGQDKVEEDHIHTTFFTKEIIQAPLYQQLENWLRDTYFIDITIKYDCSANEVLDIWGEINFMINKFRYPDVKVNCTKIENMNREFILNKTLEIALNKLPDDTNNNTTNSSSSSV